MFKAVPAPAPAVSDIGSANMLSASHPTTLAPTLRQKGTSLIEALVAMVVLSLGLLGLAGLQLNAMKTSQGALLRAQAAEHAYDMLDRMRADRDSARFGNYNIALTASAPAEGPLHQNEVKSWLELIAATLPAGDGAIQVSGADTATITIEWNDSRSGGAEKEQYVLRSQL